MQVSVEKSGVIERRLTVCVPAAEVDRDIEKRLAKAGRQARIHGFRPGKAPRHLIRQRYGEQATNEAVSDAIHSSYQAALGQEAIEPAGLLSIEPQPFVAGADLQYVATIELYPSIPAPTLAGRAIDKPLCEVAEVDIERTLQEIRARHADYHATDAAAEKGDRLTIDFAGEIEHKPFAGGSAQGHQFELGEGRMLAGFDSALMGVKRGASKRIAITFPADYPAAEVAGKAAEFAVQVRAVQRPKWPALDDAFAEKLGIASGGMAKMRSEIAASLQRELAQRMRATLRDRVMHELLQANPIEAPKGLVEAEIDRVIASIKAQTEARQKSLGAAAGIARPTEERATFAAEARRQVILGLIARHIIAQENMQPEAAAVRARVEEMAGSYDDGAAMIDWHYAEPSRLARVEAMVLEEQLVARMLETAEVTEKPVSFQDFMNPKPTP